MASLDLETALPRISGAPSIRPDAAPPSTAGAPISTPILSVSQQGPSDHNAKGRFSLARMAEATVQAILIIPLAVVVCAIVAFAILPLHSGFRWDDLSDGYE
jgi:hypothetical protein